MERLLNGGIQNGINPFGSDLQAHSIYHCKMSSKIVKCGELECRGPEFPPEFEGFVGKIGPTSRVLTHSDFNDSIG